MFGKGFGGGFGGMMGRGGPSDEQKAQIARFQEIEAKIQRGEAREEDYPDYMEAKRGYAAKKDKEADNIDPDTGISLLEGPRDTAEGAAAADGACEAVDLAFGLFPDLRAGSPVVAVPVGNIVELIGPDRAVGFASGDLFSQSTGIANVVVRVGIGDRRD